MTKRQRDKLAFITKINTELKGSSIRLLLILFEEAEKTDSLTIVKTLRELRNKRLCPLSIQRALKELEAKGYVKRLQPISGVTKPIELLCLY